LILGKTVFQIDKDGNLTDGQGRIIDPKSLENDVG